jgi:O-antigen biosynthesis protein WbqP
MGIAGSFATLVLASNIKAETRLKEVNNLLSTYKSDIDNIPIKSINGTIKRILDLLTASLLMISLSPLMITIALVVKFSSKGPIFEKQIKVGKGGSEFAYYTFRTKKWVGNSIFEQREYSPVGKFLRKCSLDEVPSVINVLKGDMSIVGVSSYNPSTVYELTNTQKEVILSQKPGIANLWSISWSKKKFDLKEKINFDLYYASNVSLSLDFYILLKTCYMVMSKPGEY